jgi:hypothetical protein
MEEARRYVHLDNLVSYAHSRTYALVLGSPQHKTGPAPGTGSTAASDAVFMLRYVVDLIQQLLSTAALTSQRLRQLLWSCSGNDLGLQMGSLL